LALLRPLFLSKRKVESTSGWKQRSRQVASILVLLIPGLLCWRSALKMSANVLDNDCWRRSVQTHQVVTLFAGWLLVSAGMIGAGRKSRLRLRFSRAEICDYGGFPARFRRCAPIRSMTLIHVPVDEGHFAKGVLIFI